jgi:para-aminobenzoate synthetase
VLEVTHKTTDIFEELGSFNATMYHSLHVDLGYMKEEHDLWVASAHSPELEPLAWDLQDKVNGPVLMAVRHISKPFWGVQYHPESITTGTRIGPEGITFGTEGCQMMQQWWKAAEKWHSQNLNLQTATRPQNSTKNSLKLVAASSSTALADRHFASLSRYIQHSQTVQWTSFDGHSLSVRSICQELGITNGKAVILESALKPNNTPLRDDTGRYSMIGILPADTPIYMNYTLSPSAEVHIDAKDCQIVSQIGDFWIYLDRWMQNLKSTRGAPEVPFWGGFMGYVSYEAGLHTIGVNGSNNGADRRRSHQSGQTRPASTFALILRSIVVDHLTNQVYVQSIKAHDQEWVQNTETRLCRDVALHKNTSRPLTPPVKEEIGLLPAQVVTQQIPDSARYMEKVRRCQLAIQSGDSYELCLTDRTTLRVDHGLLRSDNVWPLYRKTIEINPAPFAAYMHLKSGDQQVTVISSSPERFLSWNRTGRCQYRPIKGTVKKTAGMTLQDAEAILKPHINAKDVAENLMITDLIRHDIHGVAGAGNVHVTKLFGVEEYQTVFQLVSVIEGQLPRVMEAPKEETHANAVYQPRYKSYTRKDGIATPDTDDEPDLTKNSPSPQPSGVDVLAASLPPGSMTGAPKKRSCELLQDIEENVPRGIYSGVLGYLDAGGGGDFAVVIRTAYRWSDDQDEDGYDLWTIGAGGAVTSQSTPEGETEEMAMKLNSVLRAFQGVDGEAVV